MPSFGAIALAALALWFAFLAARAHVRRARANSLPPGVTPRPDLAGLSETSYDAATRALREFAAEYRLTFQHGKCTRQAVMGLHDLRNQALQHMYELRMRLPNDLDAEVELTQYIEDTDALLRAHLQDAQARCGETMLLPGPIDDSFYRRFYRAHNDAVV